MPDAELEAALDAPAGPAARARPGGRGLQRRRRLGVPGLGRPRHARARAGARGHRGVAVAGRRRAGRLPRRWPTEWGLRWQRGRHRRAGATPPTARNDGDRCFWCKDALMDARRRRSPRPSGATVVLGRQPRRPRRPPARPARPPPSAARCSRSSTPASPRPTCGPGRRRLGLRTWDKPAAACLASRLPYGTPVTVGVLGAVERAEAGAARRSGFAELRVRHYGDIARLEVPVDDLGRVVAPARRGGRRGAGRRLPLRHPRPRGPAVRQPQRRARRRRRPVRLTRRPGSRSGTRCGRRRGARRCGPWRPARSRHGPGLLRAAHHQRRSRRRTAAAAGLGIGVARRGAGRRPRASAGTGWTGRRTTQW